MQRMRDGAEIADAEQLIEVEDLVNQATAPEYRTVGR